MDAAATIATVHSVQNILQALASALTMTAYLFPPPAHPNDGDTFDYIVVGAGSAGSVIANRLTEDPGVRVLLVEAGGDPPLESILPPYMSYMRNSSVDWNYTSIRDGTQECHKDGVTAMTRGRMLGGCSSINFMGYARGSPEDYNTWAAIVKDPSWSYERVLPYFKKSESLRDRLVLDSPSGVFHGTKGNVGVIKQDMEVTHKYLNAFKELGYKIVLDTNGNETLGYSEVMYNIYQGVRQSTAYSFLGPAKERPNLFVAKNTLVTKIIIDENRCAVGVKAITVDGKTVTWKANKEVVLSAGSINSPQLLMLSGIGPRQHLEQFGINVIADLPVGENLQDHSPIVLIYPTVNSPPTKPINLHGIPIPTLFGFVAMNKTQNFADYQSLTMIVNDKTLLNLCAFSFTFDNYLCQYLYDKSKGKEILFTALAPLRPESRGRISLRSTDPKDYPLISLGIYSDKRDLPNAIRYIRDFNRVTETTFFKGVKSKLISPPQCESFHPDSPDFWYCQARCMVTTIYHYVGSCAMGSVVDSRLRVYGVKRLRVADGSIMPTITRGNTNVPIMMIGEKAADMIKEDNHYCL